ncbi:PD-(D/E)XK motif protein [Caldiplasma sukawensis]
MRGNEDPEWERLEGDEPRGDSYVARMGFPQITERLLIAIDSFGSRHFLIPIDEHERFAGYTKSRGITANVRELRTTGGSWGGRERRYVDLQLMDDSGKQIFDVIGGQIAVSLRDPARRGSDCVREVLSRWRYFWSSPPSGPLSKDEEIGLFAEIWFISRWIMPVSSRNLIYGWKGPRGGRHDFEWRNMSVEVKGTIIADGTRHWVNGLDQLSPVYNGKLYLFSLKMREETGAGLTLPELVGSCMSSLEGEPDLFAFMEDSLATFGYSPAHDDVYEAHRFTIVDEVLYRVEGRFPRITSSSFQGGGPPHGVEKVRYQINLDGFEDLIVARKPAEGLFNDADPL